jgi:hypothetical protein
MPEPTDENTADATQQDTAADDVPTEDVPVEGQVQAKKGEAEEDVVPACQRSSR